MLIFANILSALRSAFSGSDRETGRLPTEKLLQRRYKIIRRVGKGGMGAVYEAIDTRVNNRLVAIKEMSQANLNSQDQARATAQFKQEAAMLGSLDHPNLPHVYDSFQERGRYYLVMDFIQGETLSQMLGKLGGQAFPVEQLLYYAIPLCNILAYLHQQNPPVIFRDLKPSNVMITPQAKVFLVDFGIARVFKEGQSSDTVPFGTPGYASPELEYGGQTDQHSDLYSLGATLHHCLTLQVPKYAASGIKFLPVRQYNRQVPPDLDQLIMRLVETNSNSRPASALEVKHRLTTIRQSIQTLSTMASTISPQGGGPHIVGKHPYGSNPDVDASPTIDMNASPTSTPIDWQEALAPVVTGLQRVGSAIKNGVTSIPLPSVPLPAGQIQNLGQNVRIAFTRGLSAVWTRLFTILFTILAALAVVGGISAFFISQGSGHFVAFVLSFLLSFAALITGTSIGISAYLPRKLLVFTSIAALFSCFLLQTDPSVQTATRVALHGLSPGSLLTFGLVALAVISLLRSTFNWQNWFTWTEHIVAAGMAATCALLQLSLGESEPVPFLTSDLHPLATPFFQGLLLNQVLVLLLFLSAIIFLCHLTHAFSRLDRWLLCSVTLTFAWLQFSFGASEMLSLFPQLDEQLVTTTINPAIALAVVLIGLVLLRQYRQAWIGPTLILGLVVPYAFLQSFLVNQTVIPFLSASTQDGSSNPLLAASLASVVTWGLAIAALTLFARLTAQPNWADRLAVFIVAFSSALLQLSFGEGEEQFQLSPYHFEQSTVSLPQLIGFNRILVLGLVIASIVVLVRWTHDEFLGRDRIVLIATPLSAALLQVFFGANEHIPSMISGNLIAAGLLGLGALIALFRLKQKFNGWDRFSLVLSAVCCLLLVGSNPAIQELPLLSTTLEQVTGNVLHVTTLNSLIVGFLFITAAISLFWLRRPFRPQDRKMLLVMFGIAGGSALLGFIGFFLFIALLTLILAVIVAARMERVWG